MNSMKRADKMLIRGFKNKDEIFDYIRKRFINSNLILVHGSTALRPVKRFSDFDIEIYSKHLRKPYYEIAFCRNKPVLITIYFYEYKGGKKVKPPQSIKVIHGKYRKIEHDDWTKKKSIYNQKERLRRECQLVTDFLFKYVRSNDRQYLKYTQKRIVD